MFFGLSQKKFPPFFVKNENCFLKDCGTAEHIIRWGHWVGTFGKNMRYGHVRALRNEVRSCPLDMF